MPELNVKPAINSAQVVDLKSVMTPRETVAELDRYIIGQDEAKRAVAIALRNRWRRMHVTPELAKEITPKNILMIGPTGVGKTEIARRLASLANAPFHKVEATKYTEVGYVGRDVESIIRELTEISVKMMREQEMSKVKSLAIEAAEERVLDVLVPSPKVTFGRDVDGQASEKPKASRQLFRKQLHAGELDEEEIEIEVAATIGVEIMAPPGMEEMTSQLQSMFQNLSSEKTRKRKLKVKDALKVLQEEEAAKLINEDEVRKKALENAEQNGIVFIDEFDKIVENEMSRRGGSVSREGVQRDLLPIIEGTTVNTKYGMVKTDHILFIGSGAFQVSKPSDLIPELQGRMPIRVELKALSAEDFRRILTEPNASLIKQSMALLNTEGFELNFTDDGIKRIAEIAFKINERIENIGARRLHTVLERLLEEISFHATDRSGEKFTIDAAYVDKQLAKLVTDEDLSRYIL